MSIFSKRRALATLAGLAGVAVVIAGCTDGGSPGGDGGSAGGPSVEFGADKATWQAAFDEWFADHDDIEIVWNSSNAATNVNGQNVQTTADRIEEYTNGHVQVTVSFQDSVAPITETFMALADGRLDVSNVGTFLRPEEFTIMGTLGHEAIIVRGASPIADSLISFGAAIETFWSTPEAIADYTDKGLHVLNPEGQSAQNILACTQPWTSLADLRGKQIRVASQLQARQAQGLGGVPVTVAFPDLFESLQRGIVDCLIIGPGSLNAFAGMTDLAPYIIAPTTAAFGQNTNSYQAGSSWETFPLALQQLIFDQQAEEDMRALNGWLPEWRKLLDAATAAGGGFYDLGADADAALQAANDETVASWSERTDLDGDAFRELLNANLEKWRGLVLEAGYSDAAISETEEWLGAEVDFSAFADLYYENVTIPNRPS